MKAVSIAKLIDEMGMQMDGWKSYYSRETGEIISASEEVLSLVEEREESSPRTELDEEELEALDIVENFHNYVILPSQYDIHEYSIMERFCSRVDDERSQELLFISIRGGGAFRRFKDTLAVLGLRDDWFAFRDEAFTEIAIEWCKENNIPYFEDAPEGK